MNKSSEKTSGCKPKILVTHSDIPQPALDLFGNRYELIISEGYPHPSRETLLKDIKGVDAVLWFGHILVDKEMVDAAGPELKAVCNTGAGYDHIDLKLMKERNIAVSNTPDILSSAVADVAVALVLAISRNIVIGHEAVVRCKWIIFHPTWMCGPRLEGATVGIVGLGSIGTKIAKRIKSFDIGQLLYSSRREHKEIAAEVGARFVSLDELLTQSDFVFLSVALTPQSMYLIDMEKLKKMKTTSILVNVSRGEVVNQDDLVVALTQKIIWGAALDVMYPEPLPAEHPLTKLSNCVLTPHIGSNTFEAREEMAALGVKNILRVLNGEPLLTPVGV